jgi:phosphatidylethanolamine-binding protein (PEBP) family uncharacterized protein
MRCSGRRQGITVEGNHERSVRALAGGAELHFEQHGRHRRAPADRIVPPSNDARLARFTGGAPPPGDGHHRYVIVVQAVGVESVGQLRVQADSTPAWIGFMINTSGHLLGRAAINPWAEIPAA